MRQPITPRMGEDVKAEHLRSHAQAIEWLYSRVNQQESRANLDPRIIDYRSYNFCKIDNSIISGVSKTVIKGGVIRAGVTTLVIPDYVLDLDVDIDKFAWVKVDIVANLDDDNSLILQGLKNGSAPDGIVLGDAVPLSTQCTIPTGAGSYIHYIGRIVISSKIPVYTSAYVGCDAVLLWQTAGNPYKRQ